MKKLHRWETSGRRVFALFAWGYGILIIILTFLFPEYNSTLKACWIVLLGAAIMTAATKVLVEDTMKREG